MAEERLAGEEHQFSSVEIIVGIFIFGVLDVADWFLLGIPLTDALSWTSHIYLHFKGASGEIGKAQKLISAAQKLMLGGNVAELPPVGDSFPFRTVAWLLVAFVDRKPDSWLALKIVKTEELVQTIEKPGGLKSAKAQGAETTIEKQARSERAKEPTKEAEGGSGPPSGEKRLGGRRRPGEAGRGAGEGPEGVGGEEEEEENEEDLSPEEREIRDILSGDPFGRKLLRTLTLGEILSQVGKHGSGGKALQFDTDHSMTKPTPKPAPRQSGSKGYNKEVDLRDAA